MHQVGFVSFSRKSNSAQLIPSMVNVMPMPFENEIQSLTFRPPSASSGALFLESVNGYHFNEKRPANRQNTHLVEKFFPDQRKGSLHLYKVLKLPNLN